MSPRVSDSQLAEWRGAVIGQAMRTESPEQRDLIADLLDCRASHGELASFLEDAVQLLDMARSHFTGAFERDIGITLERARAALARARQETP